MDERFLFRGKRKDNGELVEGYLYITHDGKYEIAKYCDETNIERIAYEVIPETVGQCTGLRDKNGKLIFEGDILKGFSYPFLSEGEYNYYAVVVWLENSPAFGIYTIKNPKSKVRGISSGNTEYMDEWDSNNWEVIGNVHDTPELLEVER